MASKATASSRRGPVPGKSLSASPKEPVRSSMTAAENCPPVVLQSRRPAPSPASGKGSFRPLFAYARDDSRPFSLTRTARTVKLAWPGVQITPSQLAELLRQLPGGRRLDGATRLGSRVATLSFDGKLRRGRLEPPAQEGMVLVWTEPEGDLSELERAARQSFQPAGECLGRLVLETTEQRAVARIYRHPEQPAPGFVLLRQGEVIRRDDWLETLERPEEARLCQVVVEGDLPWENGIPPAFLGRFQKLARLAAQKSRELLEGETSLESQASQPETQPQPTAQAESTAQPDRSLVAALLDSPRLVGRLESKRGTYPPMPTIRQVLETLHLSGGRRRVADLRGALDIPAERFEQILAQLDSLLRQGEQVCLSRSLDGEWLFLHQDSLVRMYDLDPESRTNLRLVSTTDLEGQQRTVELPIELESKERRAVEALLRYGKLSERELSQLVGSRRVGGLLEKLLSRLEAAGSFLLRVAGQSEDGRIYELSR
jgi:hypothetical protein